MNEAELIGQRLREAREARELTLEDAVQATRIRIKYLEALEAGDYSAMTSVQAQGFLRNYARFLGLDIALLLAELESSGKGRKRRRPLPLAAASSQPAPSVVRPPATPNGVAPRQRPIRRKRGILAQMVIVLIAGAAVIALVLGGKYALDEWAAQETQPVLPNVNTPTPPQTQVPTEDAAALPEGEQTATPPTQGTAVYTPPTLTGTGVTVLIEVTRRAWVRVEADGLVVYEGAVDPGVLLNYTGQQSVNVRTNDAGALQLTVNNQPQGSLGGRGELFDQTFSLSGASSGGGTASPLAPGGETSAVPPSASPNQAALLFTATPTLPLDPGDGSVLAAISQTPHPSATPSVTLSATPSVTSTQASSATATRAPLTTPTPSATRTATAALSHTPSTTPSPSATPSATNTPSVTPTSTPSATRTPSVTPSPTWSPSPTWTPTRTPFLPPRITRTPSPMPKR